MGQSIQEWNLWKTAFKKFHLVHSFEHFVTYANILGKSEEHLSNVPYDDYDVDMTRALPWLHAVTGCNSMHSSDKKNFKDKFFILQFAF